MARKIFYLLFTFIVFTFFTIFCFEIKLQINKGIVEAEDDTYTLSINKSSAVTIYVTGSGVKKISTSSTIDIYTVEKGTKINLRSVSENKIFTGWQISGTYTIPTAYANDGITINSKTCTLLPQSDLTISALRRDPTVSDKGRYMANRFLISSFYDLFSLQEAIAAGNNSANNVYTNKIYTKDDEDFSILSFYNTLFEEDPTWNGYTTDAQKINGIKNEGFFERIQTGHYLVTQSFAYFDISGDVIIKGIGTKNFPFKGVLDGKNGNDISSLFLVTQVEQNNTNATTNYIGLFGYLDSSAVIRNLKLDSSITITKAAAAKTQQTYYVGGVAGYNNWGYLYNVTCSTRHSIELSGGNTLANANTLYVGGLYGYFAGGMDDHSAVKCVETNYSWNIETMSAYDNVYAGIIAGHANNAYVNGIDLDLGGFILNVHSSATGNATLENNGKFGLGNLFGRYTGTTTNTEIGSESNYRNLYIRNVKIIGSNPETVSAIMHFGTAYVGGLVGQMEANTNNGTSTGESSAKKIYFGDIHIAFTTSSETKFIASSINKDSVTNLYAGGLVGYVTGNNLSSTDGFKERIVTNEIEGETYHRYNYIFDINLSIKAENFGKTSTTSGKVFAGGLVGVGVFDFGGTAENPSDVLLSSDDYSFKVEATQKMSATYSTSAQVNDHTFAGLAAAAFSTGNLARTISNINLYASNFDVTATREIGSTSIGNVIASGFIAYSYGQTLSNIKLLFNDSRVTCNSLSYATYLQAEGNSAFCAALTGRAQSCTIDNCMVTGFDDSYNETGTKLEILSIQNARPGGGDLRGENYCGGLVGLMLSSNITNSSYIGHSSNADYIQMQGHQSPDSAFCGGLVGFIDDLTAASTTNITNCRVENANIYGGATVTATNINNPDMYVGGIVGAWYCNKTSGRITIDGCRFFNSTIECVGNEIIRAFCSGIIAYTGWTQGTATITNTYVHGSKITAISKGSANNSKNIAYAGGIITSSVGVRPTISYCAVMDTTITSNANYYASYVGGISVSFESGKANVTNCYSNAFLYALGDAPKAIYAVSDGTINTGNNASYFITNNIDSTYNNGNAIGLTLQKTLVDSNNEDLFTTMTTAHKYPTKYDITLDKDDNFTINDTNNNTIVTVNQNGKTDVSNLAYIWINAKNGGVSHQPFDSYYSTIEELHDDGWFIIGSLIVYNGVSASEGTLQNPNITYPFGAKEFKYDEERDVFVNQMYPHDEVLNTDYENLGYQESSTSQVLPDPNTQLSNVTYSLSLPAQTSTDRNYFYIRSTVTGYFSIRFYSNNYSLGYTYSSTTGIVYETIEDGTTYYYYAVPRYTSTYYTYNRIRLYYHRTNTQPNANTNTYMYDRNITVTNGTSYIINFLGTSFSNSVIQITTNQLINNIYENVVLNISGSGFKTASNSNIDIYYSTNNSNWTQITSNISITNDSVVAHLSSYTGWLASTTKYIRIVNNASGEVVTVNNINITYDKYNQIKINNITIEEEGSRTTNNSYPIFTNGTVNVSPTSSYGYSKNTNDFTLTNSSSGITVEKQITINVRDNIPSIKIEFVNIESASILYATFIDNNGNEFSFTSEYGSYSFSNTIFTKDGVNYREYVFEYFPNKDIINQLQFYLAFTIGSSDQYADYCYKFIVNPNRRVLERVTYASYTPPLNYSDKDELGETSNPYMIMKGSTTKLIPIFSRVNDLPEEIVKYNFDIVVNFNEGSFNGIKYYELVDGKYVLTTDTQSDLNKDYYHFNYPLYDSEVNTSLVDYVLITTSTGTMNSSGEFVAASTGTFNDVYRIDIVLSEDPLQSKSIYYVFSNNYNVSFASLGADLNGLAHTTSATPYVLQMAIQTGYCGSAVSMDVKIDTNTYDKDYLIENGWIYDIENHVVTSFDIEETYYKLVIPTDVIVDDIDIDIVFNQMYTITLDLQCTDFAVDYHGPQTLSYNVIKGTPFNEYFDNPEKRSEIAAFKDAVLDTLTGYLFTGWYLIDNANNVISYTIGFEEIIESSVQVNASYVFYARWSFLIEFVEAPGTHIEPAFNTDFMYYYEDDQVVQNKIQIPLNNNNGYIFTVRKDDDFYGDVNVNAYSAIKVNDEFVIQEIPIDFYNGNSSIYHIKKENINGYVIIATSVSNAHIIVGRNTASVLDDILPQDGVFTFKYVVNHYQIDAENKSYIFTNNNLSKVKDLMIEFFVTTYDYDNNRIENIPHYLAKDTVVEVYYSRYIGTSTTPEFTSVGTYKVENNNTISSLHLSDFKKWNYNEAYLDNPTETFNDILSSEPNVSELYYIIVTPPNGYDTEMGIDSMEERDIWNYVMNVGYVEPDTENPGEYKYLTGDRNQSEFNIIDLNDNYADVLKTTVSEESALQTAYYSVTPSRVTEVVRNAENDYTFYDLNDYSFLTLTYTNCDFGESGDYIKLYDDGNGINGADRRAVITSSAFDGHFLGLSLTLGYNTGTVEVWGTIGDSENWTLVDTIQVDDVEYKDYIVDFPQDYDRFKIVNTSLATIFLKQINYVSRITTIEYSLKISDYTRSSKVAIENEPANQFTYRSYQHIQGDVRHNGKKFVLAVQFKDGSGIVEDLPINSIRCNVAYTYTDDNDVEQTLNTVIQSRLESVKGKATIYLNFTDAFNQFSTQAGFSVDRVNFSFEIDDASLSVYAILLLEANSIYKPAESEVRQIVYINN